MPHTMTKTGTIKMVTRMGMITWTGLAKINVDSILNKDNTISSLHFMNTVTVSLVLVLEHILLSLVALNLHLSLHKLFTEQASDNL